MAVAGPLAYNLISSDFFDEDKSFNNEKYDVIVGNPPWHIDNGSSRSTSVIKQEFSIY